MNQSQQLKRRGKDLRPLSIDMDVLHPLVRVRIGNVPSHGGINELLTGQTNRLFCMLAISNDACHRTLDMRQVVQPLMIEFAQQCFELNKL